MARLEANGVLPLLGGVALLVLAGVAAKGLIFDDDQTAIQAEPRATLPSPDGEPDGDTPADTIRTLNAQLEEVKEQLTTVVTQNETLQADNATLRQSETRLRADISEELEQKLSQSERSQTTRLDSSVQRLGDQLAQLQSTLKGDQGRRRDPADTSIPIGTGLGHENYIWVQPLDVGPTAGLAANGVDPSRAPASSNGGELLPAAFEPLDQLVEEEVTQRVFTINNLATLAGSKAFTALIGRVPIDGQVADPVPFRVLVGRDNLAASGLRVPDQIAGMVFEGVAIGDWTLACVEGSLRTATFIFADGTIRTISAGEDGRAGEERLGYISDKFGTPCIPGERVSNAAPYLSAQVALAAGAAAGEAFAAAQTSQVVDRGSIASAVTGNAGQFALGRSASEATAQIQQYLADRLNSTFDAIYVPPGAEVSLLIQQELAIDYDPQGRRLDHGEDAAARSRPLD